jgi:hypothetical protein
MLKLKRDAHEPGGDNFNTSCVKAARSQVMGYGNGQPSGHSHYSDGLRQRLKLR